MITIEQVNERMDKTISSLKETFGTLRAGKVTAQLLDKTLVKCYGETMLLKQVAQIQALSPTDLQVKSFDPTTTKDILSSLNKLDIGCTIVQNGNALVLKFPLPSEERRQDLVKQAKKAAEDGKVAIRNLRRDANGDVKKDTTLTEDQSHDLQNDIQKSTDKYIADIDKMLQEKIKDIETI